MKEMLKSVSHQQASQLLHNKFIVVLGDSIQRSVYKDIVLLLQRDKYLTLRQLKSKGEMSFEQDCLVEGGCLSQMHNGTEYREVRQFQSAHHLVRFYFVTRVYSPYVRSILEDFRRGLKPDVIIFNSCVWDISRYLTNWLENYQDNLHKFFDELRGILPEESLAIWNLTMPLGERIKGGFLVPEIEHKAPELRSDVIGANFYSGTLADAYGMDVLDLHYHFRFSLQHRMRDGVHWNALAHRKITSLLLEHTAQAWGVIMTCPLISVEHTEVTAQEPVRGIAHKPAKRHPPKRHFSGYREEFCSDVPPFGYMSFENNQYPYYRPPPHLRNEQPHTQQTALLCGISSFPSSAALTSLVCWIRPPGPAFTPQLPLISTSFDYRPPHYFGPYGEHHQHNVMRSRHARHHYAPYTHQRPTHYGHDDRFYRGRNFL